MKAIIDREELVKAVASANTVIHSRSPKPILRNVKIDAGEAVSVEATDMEVSLQVTLPVDASAVHSPGAVLIPGDKLISILNEQRDANITVEADGNSVHITADGSRYRIGLEPVNEYPAIAAFEKPQGSFEVNSADLSEAIKRTSFACDAGSSRYALSSLCWELAGKAMALVGTDSHRLALVYVQVIGSAEQFKLLMPPKPLKVLPRILDAGPETATIAYSSSSVSVLCGGAKLYARLMEGLFPRWQDVIPKRPKADRIEMVAGPLLATVRRASLSESEESLGMLLRFEDGTLRCRTSAKDTGESEAELPISFDGQNSVVVRPKYLSDFLRVIDPESLVSLEIKDKENSITLRDQSGYEYVVMPLS